MSLQELQDKLFDLQNQKMSLLDDYAVIEREMNILKDNLLDSQSQTESYLNNDNMRYPDMHEHYEERRRLLFNMLDDHQQSIDRLRMEKEKKENEFDEQIQACRREIDEYKEAEDNETPTESDKDTLEKGKA